MSEKLRHNHEQPGISHEQAVDERNEIQEQLKQLEEARPPEKAISHIREKVSQEALGAHQLRLEQAEDNSHKPSQAFVNKELKEMAYQRILIRARKKLNAPQRLFSSVIHQPLVDRASEAAAKTVARPSGFLSAGLLSLLGTSAYYYMAKHYGYNYNHFVFIGLLLGGLVLGLVLEMLISLLRKRGYR